jgi:two-component system cell cycle sensor histidine kinase PleC
MLDMRRIEAGALSLDPAPVNLTNLIRRIARELESAARARDVTITVSMDDDLPTVVADAHTLRQALTNLVGNAVKFTTDAVRVSASARGSGALRIDVTDNGDGMTDEEVERALQPYAQGRHSSRKFGGAGMGLPLAKGFIEANGGHFEIVSRKNEGTNAGIVFPPRLVERENPRN